MASGGQNITTFSPGPNFNQLTFLGKDTLAMNYIVKKSKTRPQGFVLPLSCSKHEVCSVCSMKDYISSQKHRVDESGNMPLFIYLGVELSKAKLNAVLKDLVQSIGLPPSDYSLHSLRAGVATTAAASNFKNWELKMLGGWATNTYNTYIRPSAQHRRDFSRRLTRK